MESIIKPAEVVVVELPAVSTTVYRYFEAVVFAVGTVQVNGEVGFDAMTVENVAPSAAYSKVREAITLASECEKTIL